MVLKKKNPKENQNTNAICVHWVVVMPLSQGSYNDDYTDPWFSKWAL